MKKLFVLVSFSILFSPSMKAQPILFKKVGQLLSKEILIRANQELKLKPITVTALPTLMHLAASILYPFLS